MLMTAVGLRSCASYSPSPGYNVNLFDAALYHDVAEVSKILKYGYYGVERPNKSGQTVLHMAVKRPCEEPDEEKKVIQILHRFVKRKLVKVNAKCDVGKTVLHLAAKTGMYEVVDYLIGHGANLNVKDEHGNGIAHFMIDGEFQRYFKLTRKITKPDELRPYFNESVRFFEKMLSKNIALDFTNKNQDTPLQMAVRRNLLYVLPILLEHTRNVELCDKAKQNVLHLMVENKYSGTYIAIANSCYDEPLIIDIFKMMLSKGFSVGDIDVYGNTPLFNAVRKNKLQFFKLMLQKLEEIDVCDKDGNPMLHFIIDDCVDSKSKQHKKECVEFVRMLLTNGADINKQNNNGYKPLHLAVMRVHPTILRLLKDHGADLKESYNGGNLLHLLIEKSSEIISSSKFEEVIGILVSKGCDVNRRNKDGMTPMHLAVISRRNGVIEMLVKFHADVDAIELSASRLTPLQMAVRDSHHDSINTLIKVGANVNAKDSSGKTALHLATKFKTDVVKTLLRLGAYVDVEDEEKLLPVHHAINNQNSVALVELLKFDADISDFETHKKIRRFGMTSEMWYDLDKHWIKMKVAGLPVFPTYNLLSIDPTYQNFFRDFPKEIESLKAHKIGDRTSLYGLLHMDPNFRCAYATNKTFKDLIESPELETKFPNYHVLISASYHKAIARQPLLEPAKRAWYEFTEILLPEVCVYRILAHLDNRALRVLVEGLKVTF